MNFLKKDYIVLDNILSNNNIKLIEDTLLNSYFPWYLSAEKINNKFSTCSKNLYLKNKNKNTVEDLQFVHSFINYENNQSKINSNYYNLIEEISKEIINYFKLDQISLLRVKANLKTRSNIKSNKCGTPHVDLGDKNITCIYYVNDSDGETILYKKQGIYKKIAPKKGRFLFFEGKTLHSAGYPFKNQVRCVINFNFKI
jgi:hypothetical protein